MTVGLSRRGERLVYLLLVVLLVSVGWRDYFTGLLGVFFAGFMVFSGYRFRGAVMRLDDELVFSPEVVRLVFTAGVEQVEVIKVDYSGDVDVRLDPCYGWFIQGELFMGENLLEYHVVRELAGEYTCDSFMAVCSDAYGLFSCSTEVGFGVDLTVYPRVSAVALEAVEFLEGSGDVEFDEGSSTVAGNGLEYADSREYVPGDNPKFIDWKASARLRQLIVRDYYRGQVGSVHIVYEPGYSDAVSGDVLAAGFLEAVLSFAEMGWGIGLTVLDGVDVLFHDDAMNPAEAVSESLRLVYSGFEEAFKSLYSVLDPTPRSRLMHLLGVPARTVTGGFMQVLDDLQGCGGLVYISCLVGDPVPLLEVLDSLSVVDVPRVVYAPCAPWRSVAGLGEAVEVYEHYERVTRSVASMCVGVAVGLEEAHGLLFR